MVAKNRKFGPNMAKLRTLLSVRVHFLPARVLLAIVVIIVSLQRIRNFNVVVHRLDVRLLLAENLAGLNQLIDDRILGFERLLHLFSPPLLSPDLEVIVLVAVAVAPNGAPHTHLHERGHAERRRQREPSR